MIAAMRGAVEELGRREVIRDKENTKTIPGTRGAQRRLARADPERQHLLRLWLKAPCRIVHKEDARREMPLPVIGVHHDAKADLPHIRLARDTTSRLGHLRETGKHQADQDGDDEDRNQKVDQREPSACRRSQPRHSDLTQTAHAMLQMSRGSMPGHSPPKRLRSLPDLCAVHKPRTFTYFYNNIMYIS